MQKLYCDICGGEIISDLIRSNISFQVRKNLNVEQGFPVRVDREKSNTDGLDICEPCEAAIKKAIRDIVKERGVNK